MNEFSRQELGINQKFETNVRSFSFEYVQWKPGEVRSTREVSALMGWTVRMTHDTLTDMFNRGVLKKSDAPKRGKGWEDVSAPNYADQNWIRP